MQRGPQGQWVCAWNGNWGGKWGGGECWSCGTSGRAGSGYRRLTNRRLDPSWFSHCVDSLVSHYINSSRGF